MAGFGLSRWVGLKYSVRNWISTQFADGPAIREKWVLRGLDNQVPLQGTPINFTKMPQLFGCGSQGRRILVCLGECFGIHPVTEAGGSAQQNIVLTPEQ